MRRPSVKSLTWTLTTMPTPRTMNSRGGSSWSSSAKQKTRCRKWKMKCKFFLLDLPRTSCSFALCSQARNLEELSKLGHFLKGSSATLGLIKLRDNCEKIQHYGSRKPDPGPPAGEPMPSEEECLRLIEQYVLEIHTQLKIVQTELTKFYDDLAKE